MSRLSALVWSLVVAVTAVAGLQGVVGGPAVGVAQPRHAAGLVVDTGERVKRICVRFDEPSISGEQLLRRADVDAVFADYGSMGSAVCALCGTGCPSEDCFCETNDSGRYWNFSRASDGRWQRSSRGPSETTVEDGDVHGWAWGTEGAEPSYVPFKAICSSSSGSDASAAEGGSPSPSTREPTDDREEQGQRRERSPRTTQADSDDGQERQAGGRTDETANDEDGAPQPDRSARTTAPTRPDSDAAASDRESDPPAGGATTSRRQRSSTPQTVDSPTPTTSDRPSTTAAGGATSPSGTAQPATALDEVASTSTGSSVALFALVITALAGAIWWRRHNSHTPRS